MLETHVTNLEQSRKLYELGFKKPSEFVWIKTYKYSTTVDKNGDMKKEDVVILQKNGDYITQNHNPIGAYLLSEIMEALPSRTEHCPLFMSKDDNDTYDIRYIDGTTNTNTIFKQSKNPTEAACDLLIWCIEDGFISTK